MRSLECENSYVTESDGIEDETSTITEPTGV